MSLRIEPRREPSRAMVWLTPLIAIALTIASGYLLFLALGLDPAETLYQFLIVPIESFYGWTELGEMKVG